MLGVLHTDFDHQRLVDNLKACEHKWLLTYDDCEQVRDSYSFANIYPYELQYGMGNGKDKSAKKGKELIITNYKI